ncbi:MAG: indolepyruvate oxidoreductase subunit beta [bacterium]|nr:indolepyruvate oxidoreductase subunit beta [bacterium]
MQKNIILAGVGGQGILSIAFVIDNAALEAGFHFKQAEVHGMAQRGGAVQSNLRYSDSEIFSDVIPRGSADMILSIEPLEAVRYSHFLEPGGWVVSSTTPYVNIPDYPDKDALIDRLCGFENVLLVDTGAVAKAAGNSRAQNMVIVGAASSLLDFDEDSLLKWVETLFARKGEKLVNINRKAFSLGRTIGQFFQALEKGGLSPREAHKLCCALDPESVKAEYADDWLAAVRADSGLIERIAEGEPVSAAKVPAA